MNHPIDNVQWIEASLLDANSWNPNFVYSPELKLLEFSILKTGWIQPVLVNAKGERYEIIDGFHRVTLAKASPKVGDLTDGKVPCAILRLSEPDRMMLTVRINRAKGSHIAVKMHQMIERLVNEHGCTTKQIQEGIGATKDEVELLLRDGVFAALNIPEHKYSEAWKPK